MKMAFFSLLAGYVWVLHLLGFVDKALLQYVHANLSVPTYLPSLNPRIWNRRNSTFRAEDPQDMLDTHSLLI